jgi:hypothetical protein
MRVLVSIDGSEMISVLIIDTDSTKEAVAP